LRLEEQLMALEQMEKAAVENQRWKEQIAIERGNSKRIFFGPKFKEQ